MVANLCLQAKLEILKVTNNKPCSNLTINSKHQDSKSKGQK